MKIASTEIPMRDYKSQSQRSKDFHLLVQRIDAISGLLSQAELLDLADHLHDIVRSRRDKRYSASDQMLVELV